MFEFWNPSSSPDISRMYVSSLIIDWESRFLTKHFVSYSLWELTFLLKKFFNKRYCEPYLPQCPHSYGRSMVCLLVWRSNSFLVWNGPSSHVPQFNLNMAGCYHTWGCYTGAARFNLNRVQVVYGELREAFDSRKDRLVREGLRSVPHFNLKSVLLWLYALL